MLDVLLVDDHKIMRDGIKAILSRGVDFRVVGEAENGPDAVLCTGRLKPHLVVMDIGMPGLNGVETTQEIIRLHPDCKVVVLSMYDDENSVMGAIRAGARGFILKRASDMDLLEALRLVAAGGIYLSPQVSGRLSPESFAARTTGIAAGSGRKDQQGNRQPPRFERADRSQLPQDHDEEAGRE
jgi:DNA-binding NarL/FixJ family response regulator